MRVTANYEYTLKEKICQLCNREKYFSYGSNRQYERMFEMAAMPEYTVRDIAVFIFACSEIPLGDDGNTLFSDIQNQIDTIYNDVLDCMAYERGEERAAQGERDADEAYCAAFE